MRFKALIVFAVVYFFVLVQCNSNITVQATQQADTPTATSSDNDKLEIAIVSLKDGYQLRNSPSCCDTLNSHLTFGEIIYINDTISSVSGDWYEVVLDSDMNTNSKAYILSDAVYYEEGATSEALKDKLLNIDPSTKIEE